MSNHIISMAYKRNLRTSMRKSVMVLLADKASDDGSGIWASKQTMADELCCSKQTVIDTIKGFIAEGLVKEIGQRRNANGYTVEYGINVAALEAVALVNCHAEHQSNRLTSQPAGPVKDVDSTSQPAGPKPSMNHTSEAKASSVTPAKVLNDWHRLPDDWMPAPLPSELAAKVTQWPPGKFEDELASLRDWAANAKNENGKGRKQNWDRAFHGWLRKADSDWRSRNANRQQPVQHAPDGRSIGKTEAAGRAFLARRNGGGCGSLGSQAAPRLGYGDSREPAALPYAGGPFRNDAGRS